MFRYSFRILPDRLKLIRLYPCGSLGQSISFVFGARVGHFAATPQSDVVGVWSRDLGVMATLSVRQKIPFFLCAFITLRSQFHLHHRSQRALTKIVSKITLTLDLSFKQQSNGEKWEVKRREHERFQRTLFIMTKHNMRIFGGKPLFQATKQLLKQLLNG